MRDVTPFSRASGSRIADLEIETDEDSIVLSGTLRIDRDRRGLEHARRLQAILSAAVADLEVAELPDEVAPPTSGRTVPNPF
jgi:hypothetical protein